MPVEAEVEISEEAAEASVEEAVTEASVVEEASAVAVVEEVASAVAEAAVVVLVITKQELPIKETLCPSKVKAKDFEILHLHLLISTSIIYFDNLLHSFYCT